MRRAAQGKAEAAALIRSASNFLQPNYVTRGHIYFQGLFSETGAQFWPRLSDKAA
jgi:hypothetical protein